MKVLNFEFSGLKPPTVNSSKAIINGRMVKTKPQRIFEGMVKRSLSSHRYSIQQFEEAFNRKDNYLSCRIVISLPCSEFFTLDGKIPKKKNDLDNFLKAFIDSVFKNFNEVDDSYICNLIVEKTVSKDGDYHASMRIQTEELAEIKDFISHLT